MYKTMDVFALVSSREGFGQVVAEAMLANLPVIATGVGGIRDIVEDGRTGILVPACQPEVLAQIIRRLHASPEERLALAAAGAKRARDNFSAERYTRDVDAFYGRLMGKTSPLQPFAAVT
jgi:glycosyltransferase involved in cell wall biosynthesis